MKIGERVRNSVRGREAMAGCRGAALTRVFVMPARARYYKCTSCPGTDTGNSKNRAARPELNQVRLDYSHSSITASWNDDHRP